MGALFSRFLLTGALATALQYLVLGLATEFLNWPAALASGAGYLFGSILSYLMSYFFTFSSNRPHSQAAIRFYVIVGVGWSINTGVMGMAVDVLGWNKWLSQVLATGLALVWNFLTSRNWVFKSI